MDLKTRNKLLILTASAMALLLGAGAAYAIVVQTGDIILTANGGFAPKALPQTKNAPITIHGSGSIRTASGELPPILKTVVFEFDKHGSVQTKGLEVCTSAKLQARTVAAAREACPNAIVGEGTGHATVRFPEQRSIPISSPITFFNGPKVRGDDTVIAHAYVKIPVPVALVVPIVIEKIHKGVYGYRTEATIPKIAGGAGVPISASIHIGRKWTFKGRDYSYLNARCEVGHFDARGSFKFDDGTFLHAEFLRLCSVRH
jgi:hypothetical protein